jgi:hypothetical protein
MSDGKLLVKLPREETGVDRIIRFKKGLDLIAGLSDQETMIMERADYADNLIRTDLHMNDNEIAKRLATKYQISVATAYSDIQNARRIHGSVKQFEKPYWLSFVLEHARKALGLAYESKNVRYIIEAIREMGKIVAMLPEESKDPLDKLQQHNYFLMIKSENSAIRIDLNKVDKLPLEQIKAIEESIEQESLQQTFEIMHEQLGS